MRIIFVAQHPIEGPTSRFRVYQFLPYLEQRGFQCEVLPFLTTPELAVIYGKSSTLKKIVVTLLATTRRFFHLLKVQKGDIVYLVREAYPFGPPFFESLFKKRCQRLVFDFDDAIYTPSVAYDNPLDALRDWGKTKKIIQMADYVVTGSAYLGEYVLAQGHNANKLAVIPTVVDTTVYRPDDKVKSTNAPITIGWIGTPSGTTYLINLIPVISEIAKRHPTIKFLFIGAETFDAKGLPIEFKQWQLGEEVANLQSFDIGIMPLTDDEEGRGKCGFKLIQYMSVGIPSVCSPVGANKAIIEEGKSGFFASTQEEWLEKLNILIANPNLRTEQGRYGRTVAEQSFSLQSAAPKLYAVLHVMAESN